MTNAISKIAMLLESKDKVNQELGNMLLCQTEAFKLSRDLISNVKSSKRYLVAINKGFDVQEVAMGSGGVGQTKVLKRKREIRIQLTYGHSKSNYADAIILKY